jgi:hypothetical protein
MTSPAHFLLAHNRADAHGGTERACVDDHPGGLSAHLAEYLIVTGAWWCAISNGLRRHPAPVEIGWVGQELNWRDT